MARAKSPAEFARDARRAADKMSDAHKRAVFAAGMEVKNSTLRELRSAIGPDQRMSRVGSAKTRVGGGAKLSVQVAERNKTDNVVVRATGPWQLVETDNQPHRIIPRAYKPRNRKRAAKAKARMAAMSAFLGFDVSQHVGSSTAGPKALSTPRGPRGAVNHPGTRGKHPWRRGVDAAMPKVAPIFRSAVSRALRDAFRS